MTVNLLRAEQTSANTVAVGPATQDQGPVPAGAPAGQGNFLLATNLVDTLRTILGLVRKYFILIALTLVAVVGLGIVMTLLTTPLYQASGVVQIEPDESRIVSVDQVVNNSRNTDSQAYYQTQYGLLKSRTLAEGVANRVGSQRLVGNVPGMTAAQIRDAAASRVQGGVSIQPVTGSRLVTIRYTDPDPELAAVMVNAYIEEFIASSLARRYDASAYARNFLEDRLEELRVKIEDTERQLVSYAEQADILVVDGETATNGSQSAMTSLLQAKAEATKRRIETEERVASLRAGSGNFPELVANPSINGLMVELNKARADLQERRAVFGPEYPAVRQLAARVGSLEAQIASETSRVSSTVLGNAVADASAARQVERSLETEIAEMRESARSADRRAIEYNILKRDLDTNKTLYDGLLQRYREIGIAGGIGVNSVSVVDRALVPTAPIAPQPARNLALALMAGLVLAALLVLAVENWNQTIRRPEDAQRMTDLPLLGVVPIFDDNLSPMDRLGDMRSAATEAYHSLRAAIQFNSMNGVPKSIMLTSSKPNEGKTTTAISIATVFARVGLKVALVDCDMRDPSLHGIFGVTNRRGLSSILTSELDIPSASQPTSEPNLTLITAGPLPPNAAGLLSEPNTANVFKQLEDTFDLVVFDAPPLLGLADAPILSRLAEASMFIMAANSTNRAVISRSMTRLRAAKGNLLGMVLTKFDARKESYGSEDYGSTYGTYAYGYGGGQKK